jgi:hypothetical protein
VPRAYCFTLWLYCRNPQSDVARYSSIRLPSSFCASFSNSFGIACGSEPDYCHCHCFGARVCQQSPAYHHGSRGGEVSSGAKGFPTSPSQRPVNTVPYCQGRVPDSPGRWGISEDRISSLQPRGSLGNLRHQHTVPTCVVTPCKTVGIHDCATRPNGEEVILRSSRRRDERLESINPGKRVSRW